MPCGGSKLGSEGRAWFEIDFLLVKCNFVPLIARFLHHLSNQKHPTKKLQFTEPVKVF
jgi:hypothetical protein